MIPLRYSLQAITLLSLSAAVHADQVTLPVLHDTCMVQDASDRNFGARQELLASYFNGVPRICVFRFDVSSLAGQFATIDSVTLKIRLRLSSNPVRVVPTTGQIMDVFRAAEANAGWVEGIGMNSGTGTVIAEGSQTWRAKSDSGTATSRVNWAGTAGLGTAVTDYFTGPMGSTLAFNGANGYEQGTVIEIPLTATGFTLTEMVNDWIADGATNAGLLMKGRTSTANGQIFFDTKETPLNTDPGKQPAQLVINYTPGTATPYTTWAQAAGLTGADIDPTSDPDTDNAINYLEFALDGNPKSGADDGKVSHQVTEIAGETTAVLTLPVRDGAVFSGPNALTGTADGVQYEVRGSSNLAAWDLDLDEVTPALSTGLPELSAGYSYRSFRIAGPISARSRAFLQVAVSQVP